MALGVNANYEAFVNWASSRTADTIADAASGLDGKMARSKARTIRTWPIRCMSTSTTAHGILTAPSLALLRTSHHIPAPRHRPHEGSPDRHRLQGFAGIRLVGRNHGLQRTH